MTKFKDVAHLYMNCMVKVDMTSANMGHKYGELTGITQSGDITFYQIKFKGSNFQEFSKYPITPALFPMPYTVDWANHPTQTVALHIKSFLANRFDLFNLIESGEAIDVTKLEINPYTT